MTAHHISLLPTLFNLKSTKSYRWRQTLNMSPRHSKIIAKKYSLNRCKCFQILIYYALFLSILLIGFNIYPVDIKIEIEKKACNLLFTEWHNFHSIQTCICQL